jgi:hypothetical protein
MRFKLRYDELREGNPTEKEDGIIQGDTIKPDDHRYHSVGNNRNLAVVMLPDGKLESFNYAYLVSIQYDPLQEPNVLALHFTSHTVTLRGYNLKPLFWDVFNNFSRIIECTDPRYAQNVADGNTYTVIEAVIEPYK